MRRSKIRKINIYLLKQITSRTLWRHEQIICGKKEVLSESERSKLLSEQRKWMKALSEQCPLKPDSFSNKASLECMSKHYRIRIDEIENSYSTADVAIVYNDKDTKKYIDYLQHPISEINSSAKILYCDKIVLSNKESGQDKIFGASCLIDFGSENNSESIMCDDAVVGKFTLKPQWFLGASSLSEVSSFVINNCPPGG